MKTKFAQPTQAVTEHSPLIVHVVRPRPRGRSPVAFGRVRFAEYVSIFEQGRPPIRRSASEGVADRVEHWRRRVADAEQEAERRAEAGLWRMVRRALWRKVKTLCCCGAR